MNEQVLEKLHIQQLRNQKTIWFTPEIYTVRLSFILTTCLFLTMSLHYVQLYYSSSKASNGQHYKPIAINVGKRGKCRNKPMTKHQLKWQHLFLKLHPKCTYLISQGKHIISYFRKYYLFQNLVLTISLQAQTKTQTEVSSHQ